MKDVSSLSEFEEFVQSSPIVVGYFSHDKCSVCKVLLPKVEELLEEEFPKSELVCCNIEHSPELAAQNNVFTAPVLIIYADGKEYARYSGNIGLNQLAQSISRPYRMLIG